MKLSLFTADDLASQVRAHLLVGPSKLTRDEMRIGGYFDSAREIDVCAGVD